MTPMVMQLDVPNFNTLVNNAKVGLCGRLRGCLNAVVNVIQRFADTHHV